MAEQEQVAAVEAEPVQAAEQGGGPEGSQAKPPEQTDDWKAKYEQLATTHRGEKEANNRLYKLGLADPGVVDDLAALQNAGKLTPAQFRAAVNQLRSELMSERRDEAEIAPPGPVAPEPAGEVDVDADERARKAARAELRGERVAEENEFIASLVEGVPDEHRRDVLSLLYSDLHSSCGRDEFGRRPASPDRVRAAFDRARGLVIREQAKPPVAAKPKLSPEDAAFASGPAGGPGQSRPVSADADAIDEDVLTDPEKRREWIRSMISRPPT